MVIVSNDFSQQVNNTQIYKVPVTQVLIVQLK